MLFFNPVKVYFGAGLVKKLAEYFFIPACDIRRVLLLTGKKSLKESGYYGLILQQLHRREVLEYHGVPSNPDVADLYEIKKDTAGFEYDCIVAAGGGSVLDTGKFLVAYRGITPGSVAGLRENMVNYGYRDNQNNPVLLAVPTTAGTGSEVTSWATVWDREAGKKYSIEGRSLYPAAALVDPLLTVNLPLKITAASALDALSHALEAYWSKKSNEIVRMYAIKALGIISRCLDPLLDDPGNVELRSRVAFASLCAGLAFSNTKTTSCHSISYPLTLRYGMEHGIAASFTLGKMLMVNEKSLVDQGELFSALGVEKAAEVGPLIKELFQKAGYPGRLRDYGVPRSDLPVIVGEAFTPGRMDQNPVEITGEILGEILESIY